MSERPVSPAGSDSAADLTSPSRLLGWGIVVLALVLRLLWLGMKPPHFDEGVNGWFIDQMRLHGYYSYDPTNYHGPFHFYVLFLAQALFGRDVTVLRLPLVLVNTANVWLMLQFRRFIPWRACVLAALAFAISPGMLFYSRYAIHESWLVFGMMLALWGAAELWAQGTARGLWAAALGVTLMLLNKETHLIHLSAFGLAVATLAGLERFSPSADTGVPRKPVPQGWRWNVLGDVVAGGFFLLVFFYSGGLIDPAPWKTLAGNFFSAFAAWSRTGVHGTDHVKEWYYWVQLIVRYEWPALLGLLWSVRALWPGMNRFARFTAIYGCGTLVGYSLVPYKTPWCIVSLIWPFFLLFGVAVDSTLRRLREKGISKAAAGMTALAAAGMLAVSAYVSADLNYRHPTVEPGVVAEKEISAPGWIPLPPACVKALSLPSYIYVQTTNDYFKLTRPLKALIERDPAAVHLPIHVVLSSYHPLPWALGECTAVGYYDNEWPQAMDAAVIVAENDRIARVEAELKETYFVEKFQLRDAMDSGKLYFNAARFAPLFPGRKPDFQGHAATTPATTPAAP